ncbi:transient receptor potential cation channel subfamily M member 2-like isoform X1 [Mytilus californianus]|uniref:transient receptor potential cation channel subfamily M member 2-like isoform X1 n=2 Tax=Mytilus californianus TaxID=6549 RepID=UPI0022479FC3|nr:transient receptor potential cation channel subfamily M member 2-like isoform X1 [Mytilus californianus]
MYKLFSFHVLSGQTKLPCHFVGTRVLLICDSTDIAFIHYKTDKVIIMELVKQGFRRFERVDINGSWKPGNEMNYFNEIAEYFFGLYVVPVIIPIGNNWKSQKMQIPIIRLKSDMSDVSVLWPEEVDQSFSEYTTDTESEWLLKKTKLVKDDFLSENVNSENWCDFDIIVCQMLIRVYMDEDLAEQKFKEIHAYNHTALFMYLLKKGEWNIPKKYINWPIDLKSALEYIYEEEYEYIKELWSNKKCFTDMDYKLPDHKGFTGPEAKLMNRDSECYGLVFLALLHKQYWIGAQQLVDFEYIGNHHLLVGCAILEDEISNWKTATHLKDKLQRLKNAFTERVICIIRHIYDADVTKERKKQMTIKENKTEERELGDAINHAGRLLLNHGYLMDAINIKNQNFVENDTVKKILKKMWYGTENIDGQTTFWYIVLFSVHLFVMPLLMINMEMDNRLLLWFYKKYKLPFMKIFIHSLEFTFLLLAYAYMLLFDYREDGITYIDFIIIAWMASFFVNETKQVIVALIRKRIKPYFRDWWNIADCILIIGYTSGMLLRAVEGSFFRTTSKCLLVAIFMLICIRLLSLYYINEFLGPKLIIIRMMINHTIAFMTIMFVIMFWYSVSFYALLYPNTEASWTEIEKILSNGYWILFGEVNLEADTLTEPNCTFNKTIYESDVSGVLPRCPTKLGLYITPYLKALYALIAVVIMLNLLIAMYSNIFEDVHTKSMIYWSELQTSFLEEYSIQTIFPIHLQLLTLPGTVVAIVWLFCANLRQQNSDENDRTKELNHHPQFVRGMVYISKIEDFRTVCLD